LKFLSLFSGIEAASQAWKPLGWECERLQGFPDDHTLITVKGKPAADGPRYKALGNSMAVPVMHWIGKRIDIVNNFF
jgi:DNA (cytosine-5)-methyltransferase 1